MPNANCAGDPARAGPGGTPETPGRVTPLRLGYGLYAWTLFLLLGLLSLPPLLLLPQLSRRRATVRTLARLSLRSAGMRLELRGLAQLPCPCIVVANHCSYLDGVVMAAALPPAFGFVVKREMSAVPLAGTLLRRIAAEFVERRDRRLGARDARRLLRKAEDGHALVFFPEGTFTHQVGLLRFHIGAFAAAARSDLPVVPVAIHGTRRCLPAGSPWPRPGTIRVEVLAALPAAAAGDPGNRGDRAAALRDAARGALLAALGEPDLAARDQS